VPETTHHHLSTTPAPDLAAGPVVSLIDAIVLFALTDRSHRRRRGRRA
jgi:hypothetical protein